MPSKNVRGMRPCKKCDQLLPLASFSRSKGKYYQSRCKACVIEGFKGYKRKNLNWRERWLNKRYGINGEIYARMLAEQNGVCALCYKPETSMGTGGVVKMLAVDHDEETGVVRGLLCEQCNTGIGKLRHDPELLTRAAEYVNLRLKVISA